MASGYPALKANVFAAQLRAAERAAPSPEPVAAPIKAKPTPKPRKARTLVKKRKLVVKVNPTVARLFKRRAN